MAARNHRNARSLRTKKTKLDEAHRTFRARCCRGGEGKNAGKRALHVHGDQQPTDLWMLWSDKAEIIAWQKVWDGAGGVCCFDCEEVKSWQRLTG